MHFQHPPKAETKIVKCTSGAIFDVAVDVRAGSSTFLQWHGEVLSAENDKMLIIPEGFAHGFQVLEENSEMLYFVSAEYSPKDEEGIRYNDPRLNIEWPLKATMLNERDKNSFSNRRSPRS